MFVTTGKPIINLQTTQQEKFFITRKKDVKFNNQKKIFTTYLTFKL
jgi:hypothetical protein